MDHRDDLRDPYTAVTDDKPANYPSVNGMGRSFNIGPTKAT